VHVPTFLQVTVYQKIYFVTSNAHYWSYLSLLVVGDRAGGDFLPRIAKSKEKTQNKMISQKEKVKITFFFFYFSRISSFITFLNILLLFSRWGWFIAGFEIWPICWYSVVFYFAQKNFHCCFCCCCRRFFSLSPSLSLFSDRLGSSISPAVFFCAVK